MRKFLLTVFSFSLLFLLLLSLFFLINRKYVPAPMITNNISYNEKIAFLKNKKLENPKILAFGSSMTLSNLSSESMLELFPHKEFLNISALGLTMKETSDLVFHFVPLYKPELVVLFGYPIDFRKNVQSVNAVGTINFLKDDQSLIHYFKYFDLQYYLKYTVFNRFKTANISEYDYLEFDNNGGIPLKAGGGESKMGRYNKSPFFKIDSQNYKYLDSICQYLSSKNVNLMYVHTPVREGLVNDSLNVYLKQHSYKVANTMIKYDFSYVNTNEQLWSDSLFIDYIHMNNLGAKLVTEYAFRNLNQK